MSTPQFSLVVYLDRDVKALPGLLRDLHGFFAKFPVPYELVCVIEKGAEDCATFLREARGPQDNFQILENSRHRGRARGIYEGLHACRSEFRATLTVDLSTPLGDILKMLQNLIADDKVDICLGNRYKKKEGLFRKMRTPRARLENLFNGLFKERQRGQIQDPLCESFALRRSAWETLESQLSAQEVKGWYLCPYLHKALGKTSLEFTETALYDSGQSPLSFSPWKARWQLFIFNIF